MKATKQPHYHIVESVAEGHPDKICDQIAAAVLDYCLQKDPNAHVACEVFVTSTHLIIGGEITFHKKNLTINAFKNTLCNLALEVIHQIGYNEESWNGLKKLIILCLINEQSQELKAQVDRNHLPRTGDNSISFGYATRRDAHNLFPLQQYLANQIMQKISQIRRNKIANQTWSFAPDGKIEIVWNNLCCEAIYLSQQFLPKYNEVHSAEELKHQILQKIIRPLLVRFNVEISSDWLKKSKLTPFVYGGPNADTGLTGRKLMIDAYGTLIRHGGGSYIGKDPTKGDVSLALYARYIAKHLVEAKICEEVIIKVNTVVGAKRVWISTTSQHQNRAVIKKIFAKIFNWTFGEILQRLKLAQPFYRSFATYGFFGRSAKAAPWEKIDQDLIKRIKKLA